MDIVQIFLFLGVIFITFLKAATLKPCAQYLPSHSMPIYMGFWTVVVTFLMSPYFTEEIINDFSKPYFVLILVLLKGFLMFFHLDLSQKLTKETASSRTMIAAIAVGFIAFINMNIFNEELSNGQMLSAYLIFGFGLIYYLKGHIRQASFKAHLCFFALMVTSIILSVLDHVVLGYIGVHWFTYLFVSSIVLFLTGFFIKKDKIIFKSMFTNKILGIATAVFIFSEFFLMSIRATLLPVSAVQIASVMSVPLIMIFMSIKWNESTPKKQAFFGFTTCLIGLVSFF